MHCANPNCGEKVQPSWKECPYCDTPLTNNKRRSRTVLEPNLGRSNHMDPPKPQRREPPDQNNNVQRGPRLHNDGLSQFQPSYFQNTAKPKSAHNIPIPVVEKEPEVHSHQQEHFVSSTDNVLDKLFGAIVIINKNNVTSVPILDHLTKIGRDPESDVIINDTSVSSFHADINLRRTPIYYDRSTNGSRVDGEVIKEDMITIKSGSKIELGEHTLIIFLSE